ncbi:hypothetical protein PG996_011630 [Apiospora saccharicola]|uniref:Polyketide synthase n=1 Tax=Apiospora saccharicola TaxID=335842 RepID=A0ABR1UIH0_9PEZI
MVSAASYLESCKSRVASKTTAPDEDKPQLLLFSAKTAYSLTDAHVRKLPRVAGENTFAHRSFAIASQDKIEVERTVCWVPTMSRYAIRDGEVVVNRIFPFSMGQELVTVSRTEVACLTITQPGLLNTLAWPSKSTTDPQDDAIEVEVYVSGLNFREPPARLQTSILPPQVPFDTMTGERPSLPPLSGKTVSRTAMRSSRGTAGCNRKAVTANDWLRIIITRFLLLSFKQQWTYVVRDSIDSG